MSDLHHMDELLVQRYVDGALTGAALERFRARLTSEPGLQCAVAEADAARDWFARARAGSPGPPMSEAFHERVLRAARRLPTAEELAGGGADHTSALTLCRRLTAAALVILGLAAVFGFGLWVRGDAGVLEASPDEIRQEMEELDRAIRERTGTGPEGR